MTESRCTSDCLLSLHSYSENGSKLGRAEAEADQFDQDPEDRPGDYHHPGPNRDRRPLCYPCSAEHKDVNARIFQNAQTQTLVLNGSKECNLLIDGKINKSLMLTDTDKMSTIFVLGL